MYTLLIVDDEYNIRMGLVEGIPWHEIGVKVVGSAVDGEDAYEKVERLSPDIVLTDVSMDNMNGLDLAELLKEKHPSVKVIILSGYDEFEYVSKALQLKVFTYIIKPAHSDELMNTVKQVIEEIEDDRRLKEKIRLMEMEIDKNGALLTEHLLNDLINGNIADTDELDMRSGFLGIRFESDLYTCMLIEIPDYHEIVKNFGMKMLQTQLFGIRGILYEELKDYELWTLLGGNGGFRLIAGTTGEKGFLTCFATLEKIVKDITMLLNITVSISIGGVCGSIVQIAKSYKEALLASEYNSLSAKASIISIHDVQSANGPHYIYPIEKENLIARILNQDSDDSVAAVTGELLDIDTMENQEYSKDQRRIGIMGLLSAIARKSMEMGVDIYQLFPHKSLDPYTVMERNAGKDQIEGWLGNILSGIRREIRERQSSNLKGMVAKANAYIREHFRNPLLSLSDVADHVYLNASYFSRVYKNETGESFIEALTRIRLERAKELLRDSREKIAEISQDTGYQNTRYFCSVFKKHTGLTPLEYRKSL